MKMVVFSTICGSGHFNKPLDHRNNEVPVEEVARKFVFVVCVIISADTWLVSSNFSSFRFLISYQEGKLNFQHPMRKRKTKD